MSLPEHVRIAAVYKRFAEREAKGRSPLYDELATGAGADVELIAFLAGLPREKQQPNLLFASARHLFGVPADYEQFHRSILANPDAVRSVMLQRSTQTNEAARCAVLLPVLAQLPQPLALIEVGASAGLCLIPDRYDYDYRGHSLVAEVRHPEPPLFRCEANAATPLPAVMPTIVWRRGLDLNPLDLSDPEDRAWLETLVWPEQTDRLMRLRAAIAIAMEEPPGVVRGDLRSDLARLTAEAPKDATLVIFHTAVLAYLPSRTDREEFARSARSLCDAWISNEAPQVFPEIAEQAGKPGPPGAFLLSMNGAPVAWTDAHGAWIEWIAPPG
jgi:hypothetical protein